MKRDAGKKMLQEMREIVRVRDSSVEKELQPYQLGITLFVNEEFEQAVKAFHEAIALNSDFAFSHYYLGRCLRRIEKFQEAIAAFETSIKLNPLHAPAYAYLGDVFLRENKLVKAEKYFRQALHLQSDNLIALSGLIKFIKNTGGDLDEMAGLLKDAYWRGAKNPLILMELGSFQALETEFCLQVADDQMEQRSYHRALFFYRLALQKNAKNKMIQAKVDETLNYLNY